MISDKRVIFSMKNSLASLELGMEYWHKENGRRHLENFKKEIEIILKEVNERLEKK